MRRQFTVGLFFLLGIIQVGTIAYLRAEAHVSPCQLSHAAAGLWCGSPGGNRCESHPGSGVTPLFPAESEIYPQLGCRSLLSKPSLAGQVWFAQNVPAPSWQSSTAEKKRQSPPLGTFGGQLLQNFKGLLSRSNLKPLLIGSAATAVTSIVDDEVQRYFGETRRAKHLGDVGAILGSSLALGGFAGGTLLWSYNTENDRFRSVGFGLAQGFIVNAAVTAALKAMTFRTRPDGSNTGSFPSGHASGSFTTAVIVAHHYKKATIPAYLTACLVAFSRIEKNRHYLSDVVAGATLGIIVGQTVCRRPDAFRVGPVTWSPMILPEGGFVVVLHLPPPN